MADRPNEGDMGSEAERRGRSTNLGGASPLNDVDEMALGGEKSEWMEANAPAAGDPMTDVERNGLGIVGGSNVRGDTLPGVSDPIRDGSGTPWERPTGGFNAAGGRRNPPLMDDVATGDGGLSVSGGVAGGARGHGGQSDAGAGAPDQDPGDTPAEHRASSRLDLDHPGSDVGDAR